MRLLRVRMDQLAAEFQPTPSAYEHLGGRALIAEVLLEEVSPDCDPLGPHNKLIFAPGLLAGTGVTTAGRLSIGAKSPLTRGAKEANAGGTAGDILGKMGIQGVVVEGQATKDEFYILHIAKEKAKLVPAGEVVGQGTYGTAEALLKAYGEDCSVLSIGQAGEFLLSGACIACTGAGSQKSNLAARGGLGAVMGSKGLKAIVIENCKEAVPLADPELFRTSSKRFAQEILGNPKLGREGATHNYGTASITAAVNEMGALPTRNFSAGSFDKVEGLQGETLREIVLERDGEIGKHCMPGCVIACRNVFVDEGGEPIVGTVQYETIALVGSNLELGTLDEVAQLNYLCNDFGLDSIETGAALAIAAEAGLGTFGDFESMSSLLKQVGEGTAMGRVIGSGAEVAGRVFGIRRVPTALGQAMPGYDPRSLKGNGVTYATSPQGADHTAGNAFGARKQVNPLGVEGQKELSLKLQIIAAMLDSTGLCLFARPPVIAEPQLMVDMLNGRFGWDWTTDDLDRANRQILKTEIEFNHRAGIGPKDHRIPEYMREEPLEPHGTVFDVPDSELDSIFESL